MDSQRLLQDARQALHTAYNMSSVDPQIVRESVMAAYNNIQQVENLLGVGNPDKAPRELVRWRYLTDAGDASSLIRMANDLAPEGWVIDSFHCLGGAVSLWRIVLKQSYLVTQNIQHEATTNPAGTAGGSN